MVDIVLAKKHFEGHLARSNIKHSSMCRSGAALCTSE